MGMFANMKTEDVAEAEDRVGGGFEPLPTSIYDAEIKLAYLGKSQRSDARSVTVHAEINGNEMRETIWFTTGKGDPFYIDKEDKKTKRPLPGFSVLNDMSLFITEAELAENDDGIEKKTVKLYDFDAKKEVPTEVDCLTFLHGGRVKLAIQRVIEDKQKKGDDGEYHNTGETRTSNRIEKVLHPETSKTIPEYKHGVEQAEFAPAWLNRNDGKDRDMSSGSSGGTGQSGTGSPSGEKKSPAKKLFG